MPGAVARLSGEAISGERLTYSFGKVHDAQRGLRVCLSLGLEGVAYVVRRWRRIDAGAVAAVPAPGLANFDKLEAWSADGICDCHEPDGKHHRGAHRKFTGVLEGHATVTVVAPRGA